MDTTTNKTQPAASAAAAKKKTGGNDGKTPRALRGALKAATNWTPADEARFQEQQKNREAFVAERTASLKQIAGLLMAGAKPKHIEAVSDSQGVVITEGYSLPAAITEEELMANIEAQGDHVLTFLSKHFKLIPTLAKKH